LLGRTFRGDRRAAIVGSHLPRSALFAESGNNVAKYAREQALGDRARLTQLLARSAELAANSFAVEEHGNASWMDGGPIFVITFFGTVNKAWEWV
jgi:hypothetical protein